MPEVFLSVKANCGFRLEWVATGQVLLRQVQDRLDDSDFGASMYSEESGGMQSGVLFSFQVVCCDFFNSILGFSFYVVNGNGECCRASYDFLVR